MLITADSPIVDNPPDSQNPTGAPLFRLPSLPMLLEKAKLTWGNYYGDGEGNNAFDFVEELQGRSKFHSDQFTRDARAGKLPTVSWIYGPHPFSEHPPLPFDPGSNPPVGNVTLGMKWKVDQVNAIVKAGYGRKLSSSSPGTTGAAGTVTSLLPTYNRGTMAHTFATALALAAWCSVRTPRVGTFPKCYTPT